MTKIYCEFTCLMQNSINQTKFKTSGYFSVLIAITEFYKIQFSFKGTKKTVPILSKP